MRFLYGNTRQHEVFGCEEGVCTGPTCLKLDIVGDAAKFLTWCEVIGALAEGKKKEGNLRGLRRFCRREEEWDNMEDHLIVD